MPPTFPAVDACGYDASGAWDLHPKVSVRPEPFGALLYHFGNRRLSFVKDRTLLAVVQSLADCDSADSAVRAQTDDPVQAVRYHQALAGLVASDILTRRS